MDVDHTLYAKWTVNAFTLTVVSTHGGASPGTVTADWGSALAQWVTNSPLVNGATQYVCLGASVAGNVFVQSGSTNMALTLTNNATLTWRWGTNYWFDCAVEGPGVVSGSTNGWYAVGSAVSVAATGDNTHRFAAWTGDVPFAETNDNPLVLTLDAPCSVIAHFMPITLAEALNSPGQMWTTGGQVPWGGQTSTSHDGVSAAQSGSIGDQQSSWMQTSVYGAGTLSFWWKVSSEADYDNLKFKVDGWIWREISGEVGWRQETALRIEGAGLHTLQWSYTKDKTVSEGADSGWVDQVVWTPDAQVTARGTPYAWLSDHGLVANGNYEAADLADGDGDGFAAWQEYVAGTDPTEALSVFRATLSQLDGQMLIHWTPDLTNAEPARIYSVYGTSSLLNGFAATSATNLPAGTPVPVQSLAPSRFFKVGVSLQP
jgi:hypothetical protein